MLASAGENTRIAAVAMALVTAIFAWIEWKQGAYFGTVFYPTAVCFFALAGLLLLFAPVPARLGGPVRISLLALLGLAVWTLLSGLWSSTPAAAFAYSERVFFYAALLLLGVWTAALARGRWELALAPVAIVGAGVGLATTLVLAFGTDIGWYLQGDGTLRFPIGYRNADVAFFLICVWPLLGLASSTRVSAAIKVAAVGGATMLIDLALIGQSRGSVPALAIAALIFLALSRHRLRAAVVALLAAVPMLPFLSPLLGVFRYGADEAPGIPILHEAARAVAYSSLLSLVLAAVVLWVIDPRLRIGAARVRALSWAAAAAVTVAVLVGVGVFVSRHGGPVGFIDQKTSEFGKIGYPNLHSQGIRFGADIGSNRHDFWRVAADEGLHHPVLGGGAGSFQLEYLQHRRSFESPHDPHSIEAVVFSELGVPGFLMLAAFVIAGAWAVMAARRREGAAAALIAGGAASSAQWLVHGSYDWFWQYAGITGLGVYMLGVAAAPGLGQHRGLLARPLRFGAATALVVLALLAVPFFLSESYEKRGSEAAATDPRGAVTDFRRAAKLDPWATEPALLQGAVEGSLGDRAGALATLRKASDREPDNYAPYLVMAEVLSSANPAAARKALARASELNPLDPVVRALAAELEEAGGK